MLSIFFFFDSIPAFSVRRHFLQGRNCPWFLHRVFVIYIRHPRQLIKRDTFPHRKRYPILSQEPRDSRSQSTGDWFPISGDRPCCCCCCCTNIESPCQRKRRCQDRRCCSDRHRGQERGRFRGLVYERELLLRFDQDFVLNFCAFRSWPKRIWSIITVSADATFSSHGHIAFGKQSKVGQ